jgi:hypothetical protein
LQPATGDHRQPADLADHSGNSRCAQPFFERPQQIVVARGAHDDDACRVESVCPQPRPVKIAPLEAPQHEAVAETPGNAGDKPGRCGAILLIGPGAEDFMHRAQGQAAARQHPIERRDSERQHPVTPGIRPFDAADTVLKIDKAGGR